VTFADAAREVRRCAGTQFDAELVEPTLDYLQKQVEENIGKHA
jgi:HD-GYP domain-containing protein (c-di-GMP phosphodiesterase class II)